jgi:hypothetical protein
MRYFLFITVFFTIFSTNHLCASDFAEIPDFSPNSSILMISSARSFHPHSGGQFDDIDIGESNGTLALVDNIDSPECVAFLVVADDVDTADQSLIADTVNLNCN